MDRLRLIAFSRSPGLVAAEREFFDGEGLAVEFHQAHGSKPQLEGVLRGDYDVAHTAADNVVMRVDRDGADLAIVCVAELGVGQRLVVGRDVADATGLRGRALGVDAVESGYATLLYQMLERRGLPRGAYTVVAVGGTAERGEAMVAGSIAGAMLSSPYDALALAAGAHVLAEAADDYPGYPGTTVAVKREWARDHRDLVTRYCRALLRGMAATGTAPTVDQMRTAIGRVLEVRHAGDAGGVDRYFDPSFASAAAATS